MKKFLLFLILLAVLVIPILATQPSQDGSNHVTDFYDYLTAKTSFSVTLPNTTTSGKYIIVNYYNCSVFSDFDCTMAFADSYYDSFTDNRSNTYNPCGNNFGYPTGGPFQKHWGTFSAKVTSAGSTTITGTTHVGANTYGGMISAYEVDLGVTDADPCDSATVNSANVTASSTAAISTSSTLTAANEWLNCFNALPADPTETSPFTRILQEGNLPPYITISGGVASTSGTQTCTITYSGSRTVNFSIAAFKAAAAAGGSIPHNMSLLNVGH